jgi:hypothetical protein
VHIFQILFRRKEPDLDRITILADLSREVENMIKENNASKINEPSRTLICVEPSIRFEDQFIQSDLHINLVESLKENKYFMLDAWNEIEKIRLSLKVKEVQEYLENVVSSSQISHLFFDLNCSRESELFGLNWITNLKNRHNLKVVFFAPDFSLKKYLYWDNVADIFVMSRPSKLQELPRSITEKVLLQPGVPYANNLFKSAEKNLDFAFVGSPSRGRKFFLEGLSKLPIETQIEFSGKSEGRLTRYVDYLEIVSRARMTFSNGYINPRDSLITGRFIESVLLNTLVFYEKCLDLEYFFIPKLHYVPIKNREELEDKIMQLSEDEELREGIVNCARDHYISRYGSDITYNKIFSL